MPSDSPGPPDSPGPSDTPGCRPPPELLLFDALGRRWALRILWELRGGALAFNEIRRRCGLMSTSVLSRRLGELHDLGLAAHDDFGSWELSATGRSVVDALAALAAVAPAVVDGRVRQAAEIGALPSSS